MTSNLKPIVSIVLGSYNRQSFLKSTLESVRNDRMDFPYEVIVVDGGSTDGTIKWLTKQKDIIAIIQHNRGTWKGKPIERKSWGYFMNLGFRAASGKYICMLSDDCLVIPGAIKNGINLFEEKLAANEKVGAVAFYWRNWPEQKEYWVGLTLGMKMFVNHGMFLRAALEEVGWIDEQTYKFYHADGDLCLKLWHSGYTVVDCKTALVEHFDLVKPNRVSNAKDWKAYLKKWEGIFYDPQMNKDGGWVYQSYIDPHQTYQKFPVSAHVRIGLNKFLALIRLIIEPIKSKVKRNDFPET